jgi:hypothetical protein
VLEVSVAGCLGYDVLETRRPHYHREPAHHNLNNQQLKRFILLIFNKSGFPAHHNLNNQQLKL